MSVMQFRTKECFEFDVSSHKVVESNVTVLVTVAHHDRIERCITHSETWHHIYQCNNTPTIILFLTIGLCQLSDYKIPKYN